MVGHKVRCQCGYVFRLGSKSDKQAWVVDELKRKRQLKASQPQNKLEPVRPNPKSSPPVVGPPPVRTQIPKEDKSGARPNLVVESKSEVILDAVPIVDASVLGDPDKVREALPLANPPLVESTAAKKVFHPERGILGEIVASPNRRLPAQVPRRPPQTRTKERTEKTRVSTAIPIWTLVLNIIGFPIMAFLWVGFVSFTWSEFQMLNAINGLGQQAPGSVSASSIRSFAVGLTLTLLIGMLLISMITNGVVAVIELARGIEIKWAAKVSGIIASIVVLCMIFNCGYQIFNLFSSIDQLEEMGQQFGRTIDKQKASQGALGILFWHFLFGIVPFAIAVTGMIRSTKR